MDWDAALGQLSDASNHIDDLMTYINDCVDAEKEPRQSIMGTYFGLIQFALEKAEKALDKENDND